MLLKIKLLSLFLLFNFFNLFGQKQHQGLITFSIDSLQTDSTTIEVLKFYISKLELVSKGKQTWKDPKSVHLIDVSLKNSMQLRLDLLQNTAYDTLKFMIGIDSLTNVSGAMGGDLDPTKGMYWTWQSGYINIKLEGHSSRSQAKDHSFAFHIGGYKKPHVPLQIITIPIHSMDHIHLRMDVGKWLEKIDLSTRDHIMSPGEEGVRAAQFLPSIFSVQ